MTPPVPAQREWLPLIEALRAIAAISVAAHHVKDLGGIQSFTGSWLLDGMGEWGVLLFFMLSGFLLCESFWGTRTRSDLVAFYVRRLARIAPAYYVTAGLLFLFFAPHELLFSSNGVKQTLASATFSHWFWPQYSSSFNVDGALWTLSIEMALYASLPLLAWLVGRWPVLATIALIAITVAWHVAVALQGQHFTSVWFTNPDQVPQGIERIYMARQFPGFLGVFALGILLRRWLLQPHGRFHAHVVRPVERFGVLWLVILLVPSLVFLRFTARSSDYHHWIWFSAYDLVIAAFLLPPLVHAARHVSQRPRPGLSLLQWLGQRSYSLYLWHFPIILTVFGRGALVRPPATDHRSFRILLAALLTVVVASLSYSLVELPGIRKGRALAGRLGRRLQPLAEPKTVPFRVGDAMVEDPAAPAFLGPPA